MEDSLYKRLGSRDGVRALTEKVVANHFDNPLIRARFTHSSMSRSDMVKSATEFFCTGLSGEETYTGKSMVDAHTGMNISAAEFIAVLDDVMNAMKSMNVGDLEQAEVLKIFYEMKPEIVAR